MYHLVNFTCILRRIANTDHFLEDHYSNVLNTAGNLINSIVHVNYSLKEYQINFVFKVLFILLAYNIQTTANRMDSC
jgi:hypothetical protein